MKLENVLVSETGVLKIADFGTAVHTSSSEGRVEAVKVPYLLYTSGNPDHGLESCF
jgi:hypothetical protein